MYLSDPHPHAKKIETEIIFDHNNLDVSYLSTPGRMTDKYDLVGSIQVRTFGPVFGLTEFSAFRRNSFWALYRIRF